MQTGYRYDFLLRRDMRKRCIIFLILCLPAMARADWSGYWPVTANNYLTNYKPAMNDLLAAMSERVMVASSNYGGWTQGASGDSKFHFTEVHDFNYATSSISTVGGLVFTNWYQVQTNYLTTNAIITSKNYIGALNAWDDAFYRLFSDNIWVDWTKEGSSWLTYFATPQVSSNWSWSGSLWTLNYTTSFPTVFPKFTFESYLKAFPSDCYTNFYLYTWVTNQTAAYGWEVGDYTHYTSGSTNRITVSSNFHWAILSSAKENNTNVMLASAYYGRKAWRSELSFYPTNLNFPTNMPYTGAVTNTDGCPAGGDFYFSGCEPWVYYAEETNYYPTYRQTGSDWVIIHDYNYSFGKRFWVEQNPGISDWWPTWDTPLIRDIWYFYDSEDPNYAEGVYVYFYPKGKTSSDWKSLGRRDIDIVSVAMIEEVGWNFRSTFSSTIGTLFYNYAQWGYWVWGDPSLLSANNLRGRYKPNKLDTVSFSTFHFNGCEYTPAYLDQYGNTIPPEFHSGTWVSNVTILNTNWFHLTNLMTSVGYFDNTNYDRIITNLGTEAYYTATNEYSCMGDTIEFYYDFPGDIYEGTRNRGIASYYSEYPAHDRGVRPLNGRKAILQSFAKYCSPTTKAKTQKDSISWPYASYYTSYTNRWYTRAGWSNEIAADYQMLWGAQSWSDTHTVTNYWASSPYEGGKFTINAGRHNSGESEYYNEEDDTVFAYVYSWRYASAATLYQQEYGFSYGFLVSTPVDVWLFGKASETNAMALLQGKTSCGGETFGGLNYIKSGYIKGDSGDPGSAITFVNNTISDLSGHIGTIGAFGAWDWDGSSNRTSSALGVDFPHGVIGLIDPNFEYSDE